MRFIAYIAFAFPIALTSDAVSLNLPIVSAVLRSDSTSQDQRELFNILAQRWMHAYNSNDSTQLASLYTNEAQYISSHVPGLVAQGRDRLMRNFQNGIRFGGHVDSISILSVELSCNLATVLCKYEATNSGQKAMGRNLLVLKRIGSQWRIVLHMTVV